MNFKIAALALLTSLTLSTANLAANEILLSGRYEFRTDAQSLEILGGLVCFYPDPESAKRVPRTPADQRIAWFCFKNDGVSKKNVEHSCPDQGQGLRHCRPGQLESHRLCHLHRWGGGV